MNKKFAITSLLLGIMAVGSGVAYNSFNNISTEVHADAKVSGDLLKADSGTGASKEYLGAVNNYQSPTTGHYYDKTLSTEVFHLSLQRNFKDGGTINLLPDYSNNPNSSVPLIMDEVYIYDSKDNTASRIYGKGSLDSSDFTISKDSVGYTLNVPKKEDISDYTVVFTISPLNSFEINENSYQHPSYGVNVEAKSNDGKVDGSDYASTNGGWGVLWGQFEEGNQVLLDKYEDSTYQGNSYDLNKQVTNIKDFTNHKWIIRDMDGNSLDTDNISDLSVGTYYVTFYGNKDNKWSWDTFKLDVKAPQPSPAPTSQGKVIAKYVDTKGKTISSSVTLTGNVGDDYLTTSKEIKGYTLVNITGNPSGKFTNKDITITYSYKKSATPVYKGSVIYATKKIGLYKYPTFNKKYRKVWYNKKARVNRPMFVVTGFSKSVSGNLRYKVKDVNHNSKTAGLTGYVTANSKYTSPVYYYGIPKSKKVVVINPKGVNSYKNGKVVKRYSKGSVLKVSSIFKQNLTTKFVLPDGSYITGNKKLVKIN